MSAEVLASRLLAMLPWLHQHPGVTPAQVAARFGVSEEQVLKDVVLLTLTGPGMYGGQAVDIDYYDGGRITVVNAQELEIPLRLSVHEAVALLAGLRLLAQVPGTHDRDALVSVTAMVEEATGARAAEAGRLAFVVEEADPVVVATVREALATGLALHLTYVAGGTETRTERTVDPMRLLVVDGAVYLEGWCRGAQAVRTFRADRIEAVEILDEPAAVPGSADPVDPQAIVPTGPTVVFDLEPGGRWLSDTVPVLKVTDRDDGGALVTLAMGTQAWVVRQALRLGGQAAVIDPPEVRAAVLARAQDALRAYDLPVD